MLSERYLQLLTAYVDGEASARQRRTVQRLLHKSGAARRLLRQLQDDAAQLDGLRRHHLGPDFTTRVLQAITDVKPLPATEFRKEAAPAALVPAWISWAVAASVLIAVGTLSYFAYPILNRARDRGAGIADQKDPIKKNRGNHNKDTAPKSDNSDKELAFDVPQSRFFFDLPLEPASDQPEEKPKKDDTKVAKNKPDPKDNTPEVLGAIKRLRLPPIALPNFSVMIPLRDTAQKEQQSRLLDKLGRDSSQHVQLLCRDTASGLNQLRQAFAARGIKLLVDQEAQKRLQNPRLKSNFVIYTENVSPQELLAIFQHLGQLDQQAALKTKKGEQFGFMVVNSMSKNLKLQLGKFLDSNVPRSPARKAGTLPKGSASKALADGTADQIAKALKNKGHLQPAAGNKERLALVLAYTADNNPVQPRPTLSKEVKQFRKQRGNPQPGTLQIVLVLRREV